MSNHKAIAVSLAALMLTGCVKYTNDKGEKCTTSLDPTAWVMAGVNSAGTGKDATSSVHKCKPAKKN